MICIKIFYIFHVRFVEYCSCKNIRMQIGASMESEIEICIINNEIEIVLFFIFCISRIILLCSRILHQSFTRSTS